MKKPNNTAAENAVRSKNVAPRTRWGVPVVVATNPALDRGPCTVCGKAWREHGTYPVYESHDYTPASGVPDGVAPSDGCQQ